MVQILHGSATTTEAVRRAVDLQPGDPVNEEALVRLVRAAVAANAAAQAGRAVREN